MQPENTKTYISINATVGTNGQHLFITQVLFHPQQYKLTINTEYHQDSLPVTSTITYFSPVVAVNLPQGVSAEDLCHQIDLYVTAKAVTIESVCVNSQIKHQAKVIQAAYQQPSNDSEGIMVLYKNNSEFRELRITDMVRNIHSIPNRYLRGEPEEEKAKFPKLTDPAAEALVKNLSAKFKDNALTTTELKFYKGMLYLHHLVNKDVSDQRLLQEEATAILQRLHIAEVDFEAGKSLDYQPKALNQTRCCSSPFGFWKQHSKEILIGTAVALTVTVMSHV